MKKNHLNQLAKLGETMFTKFSKEFKEFITRGNVLDLAVGVIIGSAFTAIVDSLVEDLITPIILAITGHVDLSGLALPLGSTTLKVGNFLQAIINFLLIALVLFFIIKFVNRFKRKNPEADVEVKIPATEQYLKEIRDLLKTREEKTEEN